MEEGGEEAREGEEAGMVFADGSWRVCGWVRV